ncbi:hypothetical protein GCM10017744_104550 [Streptomyces antimycoticus]
MLRAVSALGPGRDAPAQSPGADARGVGTTNSRHHEGPPTPAGGLQELAKQIAGHPYWCGPAGTPAARMELKELARREAGR